MTKKQRALTQAEIKQHTKKIVALAGGVVRVAEALAISRQAVSQWERIPLRHVSAISKLAGRRVSVVRPDVFTKDYD